MTSNLWMPSWYNKEMTFQNVCDNIRDDILLADAIFLPLSHPLTANQRVTLQEYADRRFLFHQAVRGGAKSYITARFMLLWGLTHKVKEVFTAPTYRQSLLTFNYAAELVNENSTPANYLPLSAELDGKIISGGNIEARMRFKNGTSLKALPMADGSRLRGERADVLHCDEFFKMDKEMFEKHISPFLIKPEVKRINPLLPPPTKTKLILTTSAEYEDCYAYHFLTKRMIPKMLEEEEKAKEDPTFHKKWWIIDWNVDDLSACGYELDEETLELITGDTTPEEKERALYNKWVGISGQFFPANIKDHLESPLVHIEHEAEHGFDYGLTVDVATSQRGDDFIIHVWKFLGGQRMAIVNSYWDRGLPNDDMAWHIHQFNDKFNPQWIYMDKGGGGLFVLSSLGKRKLVLKDGTEKDILSPLLPHDEPSLIGQYKIVMNNPTDIKVQEALQGEHTRAAAYVNTEDILSHLMYDGFKKQITQADPQIYIPAFADEGMSQGQDAYARSEVEILDNIRESVYQLRHLRIKTIQTNDGRTEIVRSKYNKVPVYDWKNAKKDGAVAFCYGFMLYSMYYKSERGADPGDPGIIVTGVPMGGFDWLYQYKEDPSQRVGPFSGK